MVEKVWRHTLEENKTKMMKIHFTHKGRFLHSFQVFEGSVAHLKYYTAHLCVVAQWLRNAFTLETNEWEFSKKIVCL